MMEFNDGQERTTTYLRNLVGSSSPCITTTVGDQAYQVPKNKRCFSN
jgi:hypothetical protein